MSVDSPQIAGNDEELQEALVTHCTLSQQQVEHVLEAMKAMHLTFGDAAVHLGVVTQRELDNTVDFVKATADQRGLGLIETALRRRKPSRDMVPRYGDLVQPSKELGLAHDPFCSRSEQIRVLRTELMLLDDTPSQSNVIALVSPSASEGRSLLAAELAIAFSQLRRRTLLIDADLRHPRQHVLFHSENAWGLTQALALGGPPRLLGVEGIPQLNILTAGPAAPNPLELLSDGRFERLVSDWRYSFDNIIIDTPPVTPYADGLSIATTAGRALVLSRSAVTRRRDMKDLMRRLVSTRARVMGAVLSDF
jgi:receptor protein-tyrosine kinase